MRVCGPRREVEKGRHVLLYAAGERAMISEGSVYVPLVVVSGVDREAGGHGFAHKDNLSGLLPAIERARASRP